MEASDNSYNLGTIVFSILKFHKNPTTYKRKKGNHLRKIMAYNKAVQIVEGEVPELKRAHLKIKTLYSVISPGTELLTINQSEDRYMSLGYSAVGVVQEMGENVEGFAIGDTVACYGGPYVHHNEILVVPQTLCSKVPEHVNEKEAALSGLGAIAIHALRIAKLQFGETIVVVGLGFLGQLIAKIANASAYNVIAYDIHEERSNMLKEDEHIKAFSTLEDMEAAILKDTNNHGADAVLLCAGGKRSSLTGQSLSWIRNKGKVVIVGDVEPDFPRGPMFGKEAEILISRAGGPGRYDSIYEAEGIDYPYGFVRWTEGRNVGEYLRLVNEDRIDVSDFIKDEINFMDAPKEYEDLVNKKSNVLTKLINYSN